MDCVSCDIRVYHLWFVCVFFSGVFLSSKVTGACLVTTDLIMRVNVRTTTATTTTATTTTTTRATPSLGGGVSDGPIADVPSTSRAILSL